MAKVSRENHTRTLLDRRSEGGRCELCGRLGHEIHHRNKAGRVWNGSNCLRLCRADHHWIEHHPEHAMALGLWVPRGEDANAVPVYCHPILFRLGWWRPDDEGMWLSVGDYGEAWATARYSLPVVRGAHDALNDHLRRPS